MLYPPGVSLDKIFAIPTVCETHLFSSGNPAKCSSERTFAQEQTSYLSVCLTWLEQAYLILLRKYPQCRKGSLFKQGHSFLEENNEKNNACPARDANEVSRGGFSVRKTWFYVHYTLNRKSTTSPSCMTYSLPSERTRPFSLAAAREPQSNRSR